MTGYYLASTHCAVARVDWFRFWATSLPHHKGESTIVPLLPLIFRSANTPALKFMHNEGTPLSGDVGLKCEKKPPKKSQYSLFADKQGKSTALKHWRCQPAVQE